MSEKNEFHVEANIFDKEEIFPDCTVQVLTNTATGGVSVAWWPNDSPPFELGSMHEEEGEE